MYDHIKAQDPELFNAIELELNRQRNKIELIASENFVSEAVLEAVGSPLTNKYAEGYPGRRYYGGNTIIDKVELLCMDRALKLFKLSPAEWHVNVQPLSGSPANFALYSALVPLGGKIMGMKLTSGGHLTHGHPLSMTGKLWVPLQFEVDPKSEVIDYEAIKKMGGFAYFVVEKDGIPTLIKNPKYKTVPEAIIT